MADSLKDSYNLMMGLRLLAVLLLLLPPLSEARASFGFHAGSHFGIGKMGSERGSRPKRDMGTMDLQFMPGYRLLPMLMAGLMLEYRFMSQLEDESAVGSDFGGRGFHWGLAAMAEPGPVKLMLGYDFRSRHWFSGPDTTFKGSGWRFLVGYKFMPAFSFDLQFVTSTYNTQEVNGVESGLNNDNLTHSNVSIGVSYSY